MELSTLATTWIQDASQAIDFSNNPDHAAWPLKSADVELACRGEQPDCGQDVCVRRGVQLPAAGVTRRLQRVCLQRSGFYHF
jgi:hypothetical protein